MIHWIQCKSHILPDCVGCFLFVIGLTLSQCEWIVPFVVGGWFILSGIFLFFYYWRNYSTLLNVKGIFGGIWFLTVGLAALRIHPDQVKWSFLTWLCIGFFYLGVCIAYDVISYVLRNIPEGKPFFKVGRYGIVLWGILPIIGFVADVVYSGYIPMFSQEQQAYMNFGMPFVHYLTVFSGVYPALALRVIRDKELSLSLRICIGALILINVFIPFAIVSRQLTLMQIVIASIVFLVSYGVEQRIRFWHILVFVLICSIMFLVMSGMRHQSDAYIKEVFNLPVDTSSGEMLLWKLYMYIAFSFDNFNKLVVSSTTFYWGAKSLYPFAVLIGLGGLMKYGFEVPIQFQILPTHNTFTALSTPYMDFGIVGVVIFAFLVGILASLSENGVRLNYMNEEGVVAYGLIIYSIAISFFTDEFGLPVFWVYIGLLIVYRLFDILVYKTLSCSKNNNT